MDASIRDQFSRVFAPDEVGRIENFLNRGFSLNGQIAIASIFLFAKGGGKDVIGVLAECEREWERSWQYQHPQIKGDPDAPGNAGIQNRASLENIYHALGIPSPLRSPQSEDTPPPQKAFVARTENSVYRFGKANRKRERDVSRDERPLDFTRCIIRSCTVLNDMVIQCLDGPHENWYTTHVLSIE